MNGKSLADWIGVFVDRTTLKTALHCYIKVLWKPFLLFPNTHLGKCVESRCCRSRWSSSSSWRHFWSCSRTPGPSSRRATGRIWPSPPSRRSAWRSSSRRRLQPSRRCGWHRAGTHTSDLKHTTEDAEIAFHIEITQKRTNSFSLRPNRPVFFNSAEAGCWCYISRFMLLNGWKWRNKSNTS